MNSRVFGLGRYGSRVVGIIRNNGFDIKTSGRNVGLMRSGLLESRSFSGKPIDFSLINSRIKSKNGNILLVLENGENHGLISLEEAREIAKEKKLDLMQVALKKESGSDEAGTPVCKLVNVKEQEKNAKEQVKKREAKEKMEKNMKEVQFSTNIAEHDLKMKINSIASFLEKSKAVLINIYLRKSNEKEVDKMQRAQEILSTVVSDIEARGVGAERQGKRKVSPQRIITEIFPTNSN